MAAEVVEIEPIYQRMGAAVRELRLEAGWTQEDLACQIGLTRTSITNIEVGRQRLMMHQVVELADVFAVTVGRIVGAAIEPPTVSGKEYRDQIAALKRRIGELETALRTVARCATAAVT